MGEDTIDVIVRLVQAILVALVGGGGVSGWLAWRAKRKADRAQVSKNTEQATEQHRRDLLKELRLVTDYADRLRDQVRALGGDPIDWPDALKHLS